MTSLDRELNVSNIYQYSKVTRNVNSTPLSNRSAFKNKGKQDDHVIDMMPKKEGVITEFYPQSNVYGNAEDMDH